MQNRIWIVLLFLLGGLVPRSTKAQVNLYSRLTDPLAIARINDSLRSPLVCVTHDLIPDDTDVDGFHILATAEGRGVISHIWFVHNAPDSSCHLKLWVDDSLLVSCTIQEFVTQPHGLLRAPLCRPSSGSSVCDVQIPYGHRFRLTYQQTVAALFWYAIQWRPVDPNIELPRLGSNALQQLQSTAEDHYLHSNRWDGVAHDSIGFNHRFEAHDTLDIGEIDGSGCILDLFTQTALHDMESLDSLILEINWDHNPTPAVQVSLGKLFGALSWPRPATSRFFSTDNSGRLHSFYPMPFAHHARVRIVNLRANNYHQVIQGYLLFDHRSVDPSAYGYFCTESHRSNPTRYHVWHPILHTRGEGNYVGMILQMPTISAPAALEGDPRFVVDSDSVVSFRLTGTEDYFNGGNYFATGPFTDPFGGLINWPTSMYRFHVLDVMSFRSSMDIDFQHGFHTDVREDYHSTAVFYKRWIPFWTDRDSITPTEALTVHGEGYVAGNSIAITLDAQPLATVTADLSGAFEWRGFVSALVQTGPHVFAVNGTKLPEPIMMLHAPTILPLTDSLPIVLQVGDSLSFTAVGFDSAEVCTILLDSLIVAPHTPIVVGGHNRLFSMCTIPMLSAGPHQLKIVGDHRDTAVCSIPINVTELRDYEFDHLLPSAQASNLSAVPKVVSSRWLYHWGEQAVVVFRPQQVGDSISFRIWVPRADTFVVSLFSTIGQAFGSFDYLFDGSRLGSFQEFGKEPMGIPVPSDTIRLGVLRLDSGIHWCTFRYAGHDPTSADSVIEVDRLELNPLHSRVRDSSLSVTTTSGTGITIYPNPTNSDFVNFGLPTLDTTFRDGSATVTAVDLLGRTVLTHRVSWNGVPPAISVSVRSLPSGVYNTRITVTTSSGSRDFPVSFVVVHGE